MKTPRYIIRVVRIILYLVISFGFIFPIKTQAQSLEDALRAALEGNVPVIQGLIARGNSVDTSDSDGSTLLMLASREGHARLVAYLIGQKASVSRKNKFGDTALMSACIKGKIEVVRLLLEHGADVNPQGWTPLHYAAFEGRTEVARFLLEKGANKNAIAPNEYSALMLAVRGGHSDTAKILLFEDPDLTHRTSSGDTALKVAIQKADTATIELLKRAGAVE